MNEKAKYAIVFVLAVFASLSINYVSSPYFHANTSGNSSNNPQNTQEPTSTQQPRSAKILLPYNTTFIPNGISTVTVYSDVAVYNLTVVYQYKTVPGGSTVTKSVNYGNYYPSWGPNVVVTAGTTPSSILRIPQDIIGACSATTLDKNGDYVFTVLPQLTVTVYGFT